MIHLTATIANAATQSGEVLLGDRGLVGIHIPAGVEGANLTFQAAPVTGGTFVSVRRWDDGNVLTVPFTAGSYVALPVDFLLAAEFLKITTDVAQTGAATLTLAIRYV